MRIESRSDTVRKFAHSADRAKPHSMRFQCALERQSLCTAALRLQRLPMDVSPAVPPPVTTPRVPAPVRRSQRNRRPNPKYTDYTDSN